MATKAYIEASLWRWEDTLEPGLRVNLKNAIQQNLPSAKYAAFFYLHDEAMETTIMDHAIESVVAYAHRCATSPSPVKLSARLRSQIIRTAKQIAHRKSKEQTTGFVGALDLWIPWETNDPGDIILLERVVELLSPRGREVAEWIRLGYSWREIARSLDVDVSSVYKAFRLETDAALVKLGRGHPITR